MMTNTELESPGDSLSITDEDNKKTHPWRICPIGKHLVRTHQLHIHPSKKHHEGIVTIRHEHCADNPSKKDLLSFDEMQHISETYFENLIGPPTEGILKEFPNADKFDKQIRGWVRYWNEILKPDEILNANLIKALIATESSFDQSSDNKTKNIHARGLMNPRSNSTYSRRS